MALLNIIRRMHLRQKLTIREIARLTGVSRNTVTKHLAANTIEPKFATSVRQSKIDPIAEKLAGVNGGDKSDHAAAQNPASGGVPSGMARALLR